MRIVKDSVLFRGKDRYAAFTCCERAENGDILVSFRLAPEEKPHYHHCSISKSVCIRSTDEGKTWSAPLVIAPDDDIGQQDPHISKLGDGNLLAAYFTWRSHPKAEKEFLSPVYCELSEVKDCVWVCCGIHTALSADNGYTWKALGKLVPKGAGPGVYSNAAMHSKCVALPDSAVLLPIRVEAPAGYVHYLVKSSDGGLSWTYVSEIIRAPGSIHHYYDEGYLYRSPSDGRLFCLFRCYDEGGLMEYCVSEDNGCNWSGPVKTRVWGFPQTVTAISKGRAVLVYGHRREKYGVKMKIVRDDLSDADTAKEYTVYDEGRDADLGYPSALELKDGTVLVTYYCQDGPEENRVIRGTVLEL